MWQGVRNAQAEVTSITRSQGMMMKKRGDTASSSSYAAMDTS
jgi:hypothetical protein